MMCKLVLLQQPAQCTHLVGNRGVIAAPEATPKKLHPHDSKNEKEEANHDGYIGHGGK